MVVPKRKEKAIVVPSLQLKVKVEANFQGKLQRQVIAICSKRNQNQVEVRERKCQGTHLRKVQPNQKAIKEMEEICQKANLRKVESNPKVSQEMEVKCQGIKLGHMKPKLKGKCQGTNLRKVEPKPKVS